MSKSCRMILSFIFFCGCLNLTIACSEYAVQNAIFDGYKNYIRPVKNQSTTTHVYVNTQLDIVSIDGQEETIELLIWTTLGWTDEYLQWNKSDFAGCDVIITLASNIWVPDHMTMNMLEVKDIGMDNILYARVSSNGTVYLTIPRHLIARCPMDITYFPFDTQKCLLNTTSWTYPISSVVFHKRSNETGDIVKRNTSEFETVSFTSEELTESYVTEYTLLTYTLVLKRRPEYYIFVLLVPSFLLTMLCIIGIFTPNSSGGERSEKMTLGLTTLLSMAVILNITADEMPKSATGLPLLGYYVLYEIGVCVLSTIFSTVLICIHERANRKNWEPPTIIRWIAAIPSPIGCLRSIRVSEKHVNTSKELGKTTTSKVYPSQKDESFTLASENRTINLRGRGDENEILASLRHMSFKIDEYLKRCDEDEERKVIWASALNHIDLFLLVIFLIGNCVITLITLF